MLIEFIKDLIGMPRFKITTDGKHFYPYVKRNGYWEMIENYRVRNGLIESTGDNCCSSMRRAKELVDSARNMLKREKDRVVYRG